MGLFDNLFTPPKAAKLDEKIQAIATGQNFIDKIMPPLADGTIVTGVSTTVNNTGQTTFEVTGVAGHSFDPRSLIANTASTPAVTATSTLLETLDEVLGIQLTASSSKPFMIMREILVSIRDIFPWVNPRTDIHMGVACNLASCRVALDFCHELNIQARGYDDDEVDDGSGVKTIKAIYKANNRTAHSFVLRPEQNDIVGALSFFREHYPADTTSENYRGFTAYTPTVAGVDHRLRIVFSPDTQIALKPDEVFYLNPLKTAIRRPTDFNRVPTLPGMPWVYIRNRQAIHRLIRDGKIISLMNDPEYPAHLEQPPETMKGDTNVPA